MKQRSLRIGATLLVLVLVIFIAKGPNREPADPLSMTVVTPSNEQVLTPGPKEFKLRFEGGPLEKVHCNELTLDILTGQRAEVRFNIPAKQGLWLLQCEVKTVDAKTHVFRRAYLVRTEPVSQAHGVLRLPHAFFRPGGSNFLAVLEQRINRDVVPKLEGALRERVEVVDDTHFKVLKTHFEVEQFRLSDLRLQITPEKPDELKIRIYIDKIGGYGFLDVGAKLPIVGTKSISDLEGEVSGRGWVEASITVRSSGSGTLVTKVVPNTFMASIENVCFKRLCFAIKESDRFSQWVNQRLAALMPKLLNAKLNELFQKSVDHLDWEPVVLGTKVPVRIQLEKMMVSEEQSLNLHWNVQARFEEQGKDAQTMQVLGWAGAVPSFGGSRPQMLVSDRMVNTILAAIWSNVLKNGVPDGWIKRLSPSLEQSGFKLISMRFGLPPVLAPGPVPDTLRLVLGDVIAVIARPGGKKRTLRIHAELPVRAIPNAAFSSINFVGAYSFRESWEGPGARARDDGVIHLECSMVESGGQSVPCAKETVRFQTMLDVGLSLVKGARSHLDVPVVGPSLPGTNDSKKRLRISGIQLVPEHPGWLALELDF